MSVRSAAACAVLASCLGAQLALAQMKPGQREPTMFGIVGGLNLANVTGADKDMGIGLSPSNRVGAFAGAAAIMSLGPNLFFQPQAVYSMQGAKYESGGENVTIKLDYLQVPLFLGMRIPMQSSIRPYVMAGPFIAFKMSCKYSGTAGTGLGSGSCADIDSFRGTDYGLALGAGVELPMGTGRLAVGGRFSMGLSEIVKDVKVKNSVISLGVGYFFGGRH